MNARILAGTILALSGLVLIVAPRRAGWTEVHRAAAPERARPNAGASAEMESPIVLMPILPDQTGPAARTATVLRAACAGPLDYLAERALRESEAAAQRAATSLQQAMIAPIRDDSLSFADEIYSVGANAKALYKSGTEYRRYVAERYSEEYFRRTDVQDVLGAIVVEYLDCLERIAQQTAIESGLDVEELPRVALSVDDFPDMLRAEIRESVGGMADTMRRQSRKGTFIEAGSILLGFLATPYWLVDLAIGQGISGVGATFRDPVGDVAIDAHRSAAQLADRICFGTDRREGFYAVLLQVARNHNRRLRAELDQAGSETAEAAGAAEDLALLFGGER